MNNINILDEVKKRMLITDGFHDGLLLGLVEDVIEYMIAAGVNETVVYSKKALGCIARGVYDLFNDEKEFGNYFVQRVIQLSKEEPTEEEPIPLTPPVEEPEENPTEPDVPTEPTDPDNNGDDENITNPDDEVEDEVQTN